MNGSHPHAPRRKAASVVEYTDRNEALEAVGLSE